MAPLLKRTKSHSAWARQAMMKLFRRKYQLCQPNFNPVPQHYEDMFHSFENPRYADIACYGVSLAKDAIRSPGFLTDGGLGTVCTNNSPWTTTKP